MQQREFSLSKAVHMIRCIDRLLKRGHLCWRPFIRVSSPSARSSNAACVSLRMVCMAFLMSWLRDNDEIVLLRSALAANRPDGIDFLMRTCLTSTSLWRLLILAEKIEQRKLRFDSQLRRTIEIALPRAKVYVKHWFREIRSWCRHEPVSSAVETKSR